MFGKSPAEIQFVDMRLGRPPLAYLTFDVRLRNDTGSPKWFLLPSNIGPGHEPIGGKGGVDALEAFLLLRTGRVTLGHFLGTGGFNALLLPAHADVRLRRFPISYWGELPESVSIEIVIAKSLTIGSESAESWFESIPLSSKNADILTDADRAMRLGKTKHTPDNKEITPAIDVERRVDVTGFNQATLSQYLFALATGEILTFNYTRSGRGQSGRFSNLCILKPSAAPAGLSNLRSNSGHSIQTERTAHLFELELAER